MARGPHTEALGSRCSLPSYPILNFEERMGWGGGVEGILQDATRTADRLKRARGVAGARVSRGWGGKERDGRETFKVRFKALTPHCELGAGVGEGVDKPRCIAWPQRGRCRCFRSFRARR